MVYFLQVKVKNVGPQILNGRAALTAGKDDYDSEEDGDEPQHTFKKTDRADSVKLLLESMFRFLNNVSNRIVIQRSFRHKY